jgi:ribonuclease HI
MASSYALETFATVFQAEVYAIMACSYYCLREYMTGKTICIHTQCHRGRNSLQGLSIHNTVQQFWVPGHCGTTGNEETDGLIQ